MQLKQVCVQFSMCADNVALSAFAALRRAAIDRYLLLAGPTAADCSSGFAAVGPSGTDRLTDRRTDAQQVHSLRPVPTAYIGLISCCCVVFKREFANLRYNLSMESNQNVKREKDVAYYVIRM